MTNINIAIRYYNTPHKVAPIECHLCIGEGDIDNLPVVARFPLREEEFAVLRKRLRAVIRFVNLTDPLLNTMTNVKNELIQRHCTSPDGTYINAAMDAVLRTVRAVLEKERSAKEGIVSETPKISLDNG